jgi:hypothetical protein
MLGVFRRGDGAIFLGMQNANGAHENEPGLKPVAAFAFATAEAATEARDGALVRLVKHVAPDGLIAAQSVGQVVSAIRAEASALGLDARFIRVEIEAPETNAHKPSHILAWAMIWLAITLMVVAVLHG